MKLRLAPLLILLSLLAQMDGVWAQQRPWRHLPPDERREMRQQMREHWQQDRQMQRDQDAPRWRDLPQEDRQRLRQDLREQRDWPDQRDGGGRGWRRD